MIILPRVRTVIPTRSWSEQSSFETLHSLLKWVGGACYGRSRQRSTLRPTSAEPPSTQDAFVLLGSDVGESMNRRRDV